MEFDKHLTMTEAEVRKEFGEPLQFGVYPAADFTSSLHRPIYRQYSPRRLDTPIKEMCYEVEGYQLVFWLENICREWRVISDARFPKGVVF